MKSLLTLAFCLASSVASAKTGYVYCESRTMSGKVVLQGEFDTQTLQANNTFSLSYSEPPNVHSMVLFMPNEVSGRGIGNVQFEGANQRGSFSVLVSSSNPGSQSMLNGRKSDGSINHNTLGANCSIW